MRPNPDDELAELITGLVIAGLLFWVVFFLVRDVLMATPI